MNYDDIFAKNGLDHEFYYNKGDYPKGIMVNGTISLANAKERLKRGEYYVLVTLHEGEILPPEYIFLKDVESVDDTFFATINPELNMRAYSKDLGNIQLISRLNDSLEGPRYLLGPGPDTLDVSALINEQIDIYKNKYSDTMQR